MPPKNTSVSALSKEKLSVPAFLKVFTNGGMSMADAMAITKTLYPHANTPAQLGDLNAVKLTEYKVDNKDHRKVILSSIKKAGWANLPSKTKRKDRDDPEDTTSGAGPSAAPPTKPSALDSPNKKRRRDDDLERPLPSSSVDSEGIEEGFDFKEIRDENMLLSKSTHINRAPVMTAWAAVVAERLGFKRSEALSIASVYTEMNATSKGVSIGIYDKSKNKAYESGSSQPTVDLMGRVIPLLQNEHEEWRALVKGSPVEPSTPYGYLTRSFRQTLPSVMGAMYLLAESYTDASDLNKHAFSLYAEFRPQVEGWGKRSEMKMATILALRKAVNVANEGGERGVSQPVQIDGEKAETSGS